MLLPVKRWFSPDNSSQKYFASMLAYGLSRKLNRRQFETVNECNIDVHAYDSDIPDVIVYDINQDLKPVLIVELCNEDELDSTIRTVEIITAIYGLHESFVLDIMNNQWKRIDSNSVSSSSQSTFFNLNMEEILFQSLHSYF